MRHGTENEKLHDPGTGPLCGFEHLHGVEGAQQPGRRVVDPGKHAAQGARGGEKAQLRAERECAAFLQAAQLRDRAAGAAAGGDGAQCVSRHPFRGYPERNRTGVEHDFIQSAAAVQPARIQTGEPVRRYVQLRLSGRAADLGRAPFRRILERAGRGDRAAYFPDFDAGLPGGRTAALRRKRLRAIRAMVTLCFSALIFSISTQFCAIS